jgi:uncharacterized membrane protein
VERVERGVGLDPRAHIAILGMALATYATRAGGLWIVSRFELPERLQAALEYTPGAILVSIVVPAVLAGGPAELLATLAAALVARRTGSLLLAVAVGVGALLLLRQVF